VIAVAVAPTAVSNDAWADTVHAFLFAALNPVPNSHYWAAELGVPEPVKERGHCGVGQRVGRRWSARVGNMRLASSGAARIGG
jgi:hypothetical protein